MSEIKKEPIIVHPGWEWVNTSDDDRRVRAFARHRQYGYDQGYYDGRQADGAEERAKIVAYARGHGGNAWSRDVLYFAEKVEAGEHLK